MSGVAPTRPSAIVAVIAAVGHTAWAGGRWLARGLSYVGGLGCLFGDALTCFVRGVFLRRVKVGWPAIAAQMVRVGVYSIPIVFIVQVFIGVILVLQMAPILRSYGSVERVADVVAIAMFRELGPLLSGIVLSGFAGAAIAAEIGAMVESEEIKALRAHALNPIHFLVVPRLLATVVMLVGLTVLADVMGVLGGMLTAWTALGIRPPAYLANTYETLMYRDFLSGLVKSGVFGILIALIACHEGFSARGGAEGVGRATTATVVRSIVALIATDCVFTSVFYTFGW